MAAPTPSVPTPSTDDMIHAIKALQVSHAQKIGTAVVAASKGAALDLGALATEMQILAGLDLAAGVLRETV